MTNYNVLDLFAGCGGLSKGFEKAGFKIVAANEFWKPAAMTYKKNHPNTKFFDGDITDEKTKQEIFDFFNGKKCDVIIGGPPCQAYSTAGLRDPDDPRGKLFEDYVKIVQKLQPTIFVMENVKGILTMKHERDDLPEENKKVLIELRKLEKERDELKLLRKQSKNNPIKFKFTKEDEIRMGELCDSIREKKLNTRNLQERVIYKIMKRFKKIGYDVKFNLLNSADYGVPQKRERVFFIGKKEDGPISFPEPTHSSNPTNPKIKKWKTIREAIDDLKNSREDVNFSHVFTKHNEEFIKKINNTKIGTNVFGGYSDAFFRNPPNEPSRTVKENHGGVLVHYEKDRVMSPRELARLQTFDDNFIFKGTKSNILKQIGNAVPVELSRVIGEHIKKMLS